MGDVRLPLRHGVAPSVVALPSGHRTRWPRLLDFLAERFPAVPREDWLARMQRGEVLDAQGQPVAADHPFVPEARFHYWRDVADEPPLPVQEQIVFEDEWLVVADKPHFLPVTPKGKHVRETLLSRLRDRLQCAELSPLHRIDRETAGLVALAKHRHTRHAYQTLFARGEVHKVYEAIAALPEGFDLRALPSCHVSRLEPAEHFMQMREVPVDVTRGRPANARVEIAPMETCVIDDRAFVRLALQPATGKRHQLRVQMAALGLPLWGDRIYPRLQPEGTDEWNNPLRLLARELRFTDPHTGEVRRFRSGLALAWPAPGAPR